MRAGQRIAQQDVSHTGTATSRSTAGRTRARRRAGPWALLGALLLVACQPSATGSPAPTLTTTATAPSVGAVGTTSVTMALPWPDGVAHPWTGGPHGELNGGLCVPPATCAANVLPANRSGLDFGAAQSDWEVDAIGPGTLLYKGALTGGFGAGVVIDHGGFDVIYAHMDLASLADTPSPSSRVDHSTKLGMTSCTGMSGCPSDRSTHHLHLELRTGTQASEAAVTSYGTPVAWNLKTIGGWTIHADTLNYDGWATNVCGTTIVADVSGPALAAVTSCASPTPTPTPTPSRASPAPSPTSSVAIVEFTTPTSGSGPNAIANGPDGALWFSESIGNRIGRITTSGEISEFVIPTPGRLPIGIVAGPDGEMWFTENGANRIGRITTSGAVTEYALPHDGNAGPGTIIVGPDGALWFTEQYGNRIGRITTAGQVTEWNVPTPNATPWGMTVGPDHNIWFTELDGSKLGRITGSGAITEFALPHAGGRPNSVVSGPDGALWVAEFNGNRITRVTVAGAAEEFPLTGSIGPDSIVVGPDGALWFTEYAAGGLGRITTSGELSEFHIPSGSSSAPSGIVVGPDGNLWFAELGAWLSYQDRIGRASLP